MTYKTDTVCVHGQNIYCRQHPYGAVATPIYQTATFSHPAVGSSTGFDYSRESNPTRSELEETINGLEHAVLSLACSSGMAALTLCLELFDSGDHILCTEDLYGGSVRLFSSLGKKRGISFSYADTSNIEETRARITPQTKALYIETPSNPTMGVTDIRAMKKLADEYSLLLIADNTFLSPYFQNPLDLGADLVIHSGTKFLNGHNDVLAGFVCTNREDLAEQLRYLYKTVGSCLSAFDSYLLLRGLKTLAVRMERQQKNALQIAQWLKKQPQVTDVLYIGLPKHPGYEVNLSQSRGFGSMISFHVDSKETAIRILNSVKLITYAESLGGTESLITYPRLQTHADVPEEIRERLGINDRLFRFSVGLEDVEDLIADLKQAF
ncbi:MAG: PLP-dependent aspartate aminotransferase family protein [Lachnospiraceae bacterium]